ncbi:MAG: dTMP kinase [Dissulfurispiraceae bacterium]
MHENLQRGIFISFEGIDGVGKSTQARLLSERLSCIGYRVMLTREPGGTAIGDRIRDMLLHLEYQGVMSSITELLLYNAARAQHLREKIIPALNDGMVVITDRFTDSTIAYQGYGRGIDISIIQSLDKFATNGLRPHLTVLLDVDVETGLSRNRGINKIDRLEIEDVAFHRKVREGFLHIAQDEPERFLVVEASANIEQINEEVWQRVRRQMEKGFSRALCAGTGDNLPAQERFENRL